MAVLVSVVSGVIVGIYDLPARLVDDVGIITGVSFNKPEKDINYNHCFRSVGPSTCIIMPKSQFRRKATAQAQATSTSIL